MSSFQGYQPNNKIDGVMVGVVIDNNDAEGLGRVRLHLPILGDGQSTDWVRIATLMGGDNKGSYMIPEVGEEVLVAFHLGDVNTPYVIGTLWSNKDKPPSDAVASNNDIKKIKTKAGHEITFDDGFPGNIKIKTRLGQSIEIDEGSDSVTIKNALNNSTISIGGIPFPTVKLSNKALGSANVELSATGDVKLSATKSISLSAPQININAHAILNLSGQASVNVKSTGIASVKGAMIKLN